MRPQDVAVLMRIALWGDRPWRYADLSQALKISQSEVSEALNRCQAARLVDPSRRRVFRSSLLEFLTHGLKYVFPVQPGAVLRGLPTAHSAPPLAGRIVAEQEVYVWPHAGGSLRGQAIEPLYPTAVAAAQADPEWHAALALLDALRVGKAREQKLAIELIQEAFNAAPYAAETPELARTGS
jgi:DNA-binding transcriptional ArsR family regulator